MLLHLRRIAAWWFPNEIDLGGFRHTMFRKMIAAVTALLLLFSAATFAEEGQHAPDYILEGFEDSSVSRNWETNLFFSRMQEKTGISFQFRQIMKAEDWTLRKQQILDGEDLPDVLYKAGLSASDVRNLYGAGRIIDLKPYLEKYAPNLWALLQEHPEWEKAITLADGAIPALPNFNELQNNNVMWLNSLWLERLKLEKPKTAEELTEVLRAIRDGDPNRNGKKDEIPLSFIGMWDLRFLGHAFGILDNDYYITARDGKVTSSLTSGENRTFLSWLHMLWEENLLDHNGFSTADSLRQITDEKAEMIYGMLLTPTPLLVVPSASLSQYGMLEPLEWEGKQEYRSLLGDVIRGTFALTSACKEPEKLIAWVDYLYTEEGSRLAQSGVEGDEYQWNEDGYWEWNFDLTTVANDILPNHTISEGGAAPGLTKADFQLKYADSETRSNIEQIHQFNGYARLPFPYVTLSEEDENRVAELQKQLAPYAEETMACFVTGDIQLSDENWDSFVRTVEEKGLNEMMAVWQKYAE